LKDDADTLPQRDDIDVFLLNVAAVEQHFTLGAGVADGIVHAIERAQESRFATARWANERRDLIFVNRHIQVNQSLKIAIEKVEIAYFEFVFHATFYPNRPVT
jgi:hypothetical protein